MWFSIYGFSGVSGKIIERTGKSFKIQGFVFTLMNRKPFAGQFFGALRIARTGKRDDLGLVRWPLRYARAKRLKICVFANREPQILYTQRLTTKLAV